MRRHSWRGGAARRIRALKAERTTPGGISIQRWSDNQTPNPIPNAADRSATDQMTIPTRPSRRSSTNSRIEGRVSGRNARWPGLVRRRRSGIRCGRIDRVGVESQETLKASAGSGEIGRRSNTTLERRLTDRPPSPSALPLQVRVVGTVRHACLANFVETRSFEGRKVAFEHHRR